MKLSNFILQGARSRMSDKEFLEKEIAKWRSSPQRIMQIKGHLYYDNDHDILKRKRTMIGEDGSLQVVENLPNNKVIDNQYAKMVNQKANYLFGQPFVVEGENKPYVELLKKVFNKRFMKTIKNSGKAVYNSGIAWLYPYYNEAGDFTFRLFPGYEVLPFWKDSEHTLLDFAIRLYLVLGYEGTTPTVIEKIEIYDLDGVHRYILDGGSLLPDINTENAISSSLYLIAMSLIIGNTETSLRKDNNGPGIPVPLPAF
jgi:SPP1 family phage portal protein